MIYSKQDYINNVVKIYERLLNQTVEMINRDFQEINEGMLSTEFRTYILDNDQIYRDFEEQYIMTILGVLNMASVRTALGKDLISPRNTEVDVVEFMLNEETSKEINTTS